MLKTLIALSVFAGLAISQSSTSTTKTVKVREYDRKDNTHVDSYTRKAPTTKANPKKK